MTDFTATEFDALSAARDATRAISELPRGPRLFDRAADTRNLINAAAYRGACAQMGRIAYGILLDADAGHAGVGESEIENFGVAVTEIDPADWNNSSISRRALLAEMAYLCGVIKSDFDPEFAE